MPQTCWQKQYIKFISYCWIGSSASDAVIQITCKCSPARDNSVVFILSFSDWQLAQHVKKIMGDIITLEQSIGNLAAVKSDSKERGTGQRNRVEKKKKRKLLNLYLQAVWEARAWMPRTAPLPPPHQKSGPDEPGHWQQLKEKVVSSLSHHQLKSSLQIGID